MRGEEGTKRERGRERDGGERRRKGGEEERNEGTEKCTVNYLSSATVISTSSCPVRKASTSPGFPSRWTDSTVSVVAVR